MPSKNSGQSYLNWPNFTFDSTFSFSFCSSKNLLETTNACRMRETFDRFSSIFKKQNEIISKIFLFSNAVHNQHARTKQRRGTRGTPAALLTFSKSCASETADNLLPYFQEAAYRVELEESEMQLYSHRLSSRITLFRPIVLYSCRGNIRQQNGTRKFKNFEFPISWSRSTLLPVTSSIPGSQKCSWYAYEAR